MSFESSSFEYACWKSRQKRIPGKPGRCRQCKACSLSRSSSTYRQHMNPYNCEHGCASYYSSPTPDS